MHIRQAELEQKLAASEIQNMDLKHSLKELKKRRKVTVEDASDADDDNNTDDELKQPPEKYVATCARKYSTYCCPWVELEAVDALTFEPPAIDPKDPLQRLGHDDGNTITVPEARQAEIHAYLSRHPGVRALLGKQVTWIPRIVRP